MELVDGQRLALLQPNGSPALDEHYEPRVLTVLTTARRWATVQPDGWHGHWPYPYRVEIATSKVYGTRKGSPIPTGQTVEINP